MNSKRQDPDSYQRLGIISRVETGRVLTGLETGPKSSTLDDCEGGERIGAPASKSQMSFLQLSCSFSFVTESNVPSRSSDSAQQKMKGDLSEPRANSNQIAWPW